MEFRSVEATDSVMVKGVRDSKKNASEMAASWVRTVRREAVQASGHTNVFLLR
jgi:hypothetical protein